MSFDHEKGQLKRLYRRDVKPQRFACLVLRIGYDTLIQWAIARNPRESNIRPCTVRCDVDAEPKFKS